MRRFFVIFTLLLILGAVGFYYYFFTQEQPKDTLILYGNVDVRQVDIAFRVSGRVNEIYFEEGDFVPAGALMGILDKQPYSDQVVQAKANIESVHSSLKNAQIILKRRTGLIGDGSISQEDLDNATANKAVLEGNLRSSEAALSVAEANLSFTEAYAPIDGIILSRIREPGSIVNPANPIYTLSVLSPVWIRAYVPEPYLGVIYPNMKAEIITDTPGGPTYTGYIGFISPMAEFTPKTVETTQLRTDLVYRLRIYVDNPDQGLRQGMPVTVRLSLGQRQG